MSAEQKQQVVRWAEIGAAIAGVVIVSTPLVPYQWQVTGNAWAVIFPLMVVCGCHILFPVSLSYRDRVCKFAFKMFWSDFYLWITIF